MPALHELPAEDFEALVDQTVVLSWDSGSLDCRVESVWRSPYPTGRALPGFSVFLRGPGDRQLRQGVYTLSHASLGELDLFLTPIALDAEGMRYEIVFN
ncbi:DUF6916 family protein [Pseudofulvimonas gallinarii]|jgi:hypothetical protein|uniref:DUF6916 domain-containing protein n=1 Tax=Pseudofulvimonas gallinarii TaxID=634155 RepID=A0A4R3LG15_9GAMM|nr:hypothetical protein [Pseudofulvimonas gallinarii]TCS98480.1 hypothetical protein EDC25_10860 [Pseudofulvimonas gallinarii]THD13721.1 hypothetical protein B1808_06730 [Pseudofulvimonas gallinarii]